MSGPQFASIKNWASFQHYKDRSPPWIKLHRSLLDDLDFHRLPIASKALAPMLWLLAAESADGLVRIDDEFLMFRLRWAVDDLHDAIKPLIVNGFLIPASEALAPCKQDATPEERRGETETEVREEHYPTDSGGTAEAAVPPVEPKKSIICPHTELLALWQKHLPMAPQPKVLTETRRRQLRSRWVEHPDLAWWDRMLAYIAKSRFLTGGIQNGDRVPFVVTLDWLIKPANMAKVIEGHYHREAA